MKTIRIILTAVILTASVSRSEAQLAELDFIYGYTNDARLLLQEYIRPYANIMGANLNAGWYNTAEPHKLGGFDITATFSIAYAPPSALSYDLNELSGLSADFDPSNSIAPTAAGDMEVLPELVYTAVVDNPVSGVAETYELARVSHPNGSGLDWLPMPMAQASIGLIKGTDLTIRYVPTLRMGDFGRIGLYGVGGKHSISQWIPVLKQLKFINVSLQGGYTKLSTSAHLDMQPIAEIPIANPPNFNDQFLNMDVSGWTLNLIASQSIPIITVYEGIGYSNSLVELALVGKYPINVLVDEQGDNFGKTTYKVVENPIEALQFENFRNLRLNAGIRLKLGVLTLHYDFTRTLYTTHTAGLGISFR